MSSKKIRTQHCKNCNYDFKIDLAIMNYCPNCGQRNHSPRMPFFHYLYELMEGIFHLDNKTWLTVKTLILHPGKITKDYIEDKRVRYSPPVRMYIWCTALFMFSYWLLIDIGARYSEPSVESGKALSLRFDEMSDSSSTSIKIISNTLWPTLPSTPLSTQRELKSIPDHKIKSWLQTQMYKTDYFHILLIKAYRNQINSKLTLSAYTKKMTTGNNLIFVLSLPLNALILFPILYRKKMYYYDSMIFTIHTNTWIPLFQSIWLWILAAMISFFNAPYSIFLSIPIINAVYYFMAIKKTFDFSLVSTFIRWLPIFCIDTLYHWIILLLVAAWYMN